MTRSVPDSSTKKFGIHNKDKKNEGEGRTELRDEGGREGWGGGGGDLWPPTKTSDRFHKSFTKSFALGISKWQRVLEEALDFISKTVSHVTCWHISGLCDDEAEIDCDLGGSPKLALSTHSPSKKIFPVT